MPRKENSKAKTWERDRRSRMNAYFNNLAELLPPQPDGRKRNKVDIIIQAIKYIKELNTRTDELMQTSASTVHKEELARLKKLVHQLFMRTHLLSNLLKDAGITVPAEPALEKISPLKWSNKINVNTVERFLNNFDTHNKNEKKEKRAEISSAKKTSAVKKGNKKFKVDNQENCENEKNVKNKLNAEGEEKDERKDLEKVLSDAQNNDDSEPATTSPEKSKNSKPDRQKNKLFKIAATASPAATLVFSGAKIMPVVAPISTLSPNIIMSNQPRPSSNSSIILNNAQPSQMFVVQPVTTNPVRNSVISIQNQTVLNHVPNVILNPRAWASNVKKMINSTKIGGHKGILPKGRENTATTMTYKVPIPAIHKDKNERSVVKKKILKPKKPSLVKKEGKKVEKSGKKRASNDEASCSKKQKLDEVEEKVTSNEEDKKEEKSVENTKAEMTKPVEESLLERDTESQKKETNSDDTEKPKVDETENTDKKSMSTCEEAKEASIEPCTNKEEVKKSTKSVKPDKKVDDEIVVLEPEKKHLQIEDDPVMSNLGNNFELLESSDPGIVNETIIAESDKILLNLDTNTTTTMKLEITPDEANSKSSNSKEKEEEVRHLSYSSNNTFVPINKSEALHSELSNDIFASLQVPSSSHNPESISPTVAFLTAFPLVSSLSGKPVALEEEIKDDFNQSQTPPMILQIGNMEPNSFKLKSVDNESHGTKNSRTDVKPAEAVQTKVLPKIVSNETIKEPFKIMQQVDSKIHNSVDVVIDSVQRETQKSTGDIQHGETKSMTNEITQFENQVIKNVNNLKNYAIHKDEVGIGDGIATKYEEQQFNEECQQVCQTECNKDNVRTDHYNYQGCQINSYNDQVPFEMRQDYKHPNFPNSQNIEPDCRNVTKPVHSSAAPINQNEIHSGSLSSRVNSEHMNEKFATQKKIATSDYQQNITYSGEKQKTNSLPESKEMINKIPESGANHYQNRSNENQPSYIDLYDKGGKKIIHDSSFSADKSHPVRSSYNQQQATFVTTNYDQNSINRQSTTTMAHNSSNFSISSWTTISPMNANSENNSTISQFDQNASHNDLNQPKPICENLNYLPLQKENTTQSYVPHSNSVTYDKSRSKQPSVDVHKRSFNDPSKNRNIRPIVSSQKQNRNQTQCQVSNSEYKFNADNKNKLKYPIDLDSYIQSDFLNLDPRQQQQSQPKPASSQAIQPVKQDNKSNYVITEFDAQPQFDSDQNNSRYNSDIYVSSNFKQQNLPHKPFQVQSQPIPQHDQQQQQQQQQSSSKSKSSQNQFRPTVNWMMTPEIKHNATNIGDIILPPIGKELEFCHQNNFFSQTATYNQGSSNQFYNNYDVTSHSFPNIPVLQSDPKRGSDGTFYSEEQPFSWSPSKNMSQNIEQNQNLKIDQQHAMPSTLPTLVGDLALGTNHLPEKQNFPFSQNLSVRSELGKEKEKDPTNRDYQMLNNQNVQHQSQSMSFLSVSQLVEQEKAEKQQQQQHNHHQQQHQQQRKHQRKANSNPRGGKKQLDIRKQAMNQHEEQKTVSGFGEQNFQHHQQPQQQNDVHWRGRNCKSNYTAEALIGDANQEKNAKYNYHQNKFPGGLHSTDPMMPINYFPNVDNTGGYSQVVNQNFNHSYGYSSNANIYPNANFISSISNNPTNYMMSLHENPDYLDSNNFLLPPNVTTSTSASLSNPPKNQHLPKHNQNCDKRSYSSNQKKSKRKTDAVQNFEFPLSGITSPLDDYHHTASFLPHTASLYQNHAHQVNVYPKGMNALAPPPPPGATSAPPPSSSLSLPSSSQISTIPSSTSTTIPTANSVLMHHPSGTSLTNFNLTTIFPEMNDKVPGYKSSGNGVSSCLMQSSHSSSSYHAQRGTYTNTLSQMPQMSDSSQFSSDITRSSTSDIVHYKNP